jgi:ABC-type antimicrobial peptide transport system permease subunit
MITNSPLDTLAAFSIVFLIGVVSSVGLTYYISKLKQNQPQSNPFS